MMVSCTKCSKDFVRKTRNSKRRLCYDCWSFRRTSFQTERTGKCVCVECGRRYEYSRSKGHTRTKCGTCSVNNRRFALKDKCIAHMGGKCKICSYSKSKRSMVFHHIDDTTKEFSIAGSHCKSWTKIEEELAKCVLLCANCHGEVHEGTAKL